MYLCNRVLNDNIDNILSLKYICKKFDVSKDMYGYIRQKIISYPHDEHVLCVKWSKDHKYNHCSVCKYTICSSHEYPWYCLKCELNFCSECYTLSDHMFHTEKTHEYYQI